MARIVSYRGKCMPDHRSTAAARWAMAAVVVIVLALLAGCSGGSDRPAKKADSSPKSQASSSSKGSTSGSDGDDPAGQIPKVDDCRHYSHAVYEAPSDSSPVVACTEAHTAWTYRVGTLPAKVLARATATKDEALSDYAWKVCGPGFRKVIGATKARRLPTTLQPGSFIPTKEQRKAGATWVRCDVVSELGDKLMPLPSGTGPFMPARTVPPEFAICLKKNDDGKTKYDQVTCEKFHAYRLSGSFTTAEKGKAWPGRATLLQEAKGRCYTVVQKSTKVPVGTSLTYFMQTPTRKQWRGGLRSVFCYQKTRA
jgi:hypothetical protein